MLVDEARAAANAKGKVFVMRAYIAEQTSLALTYAEAGDYHSCGRVLNQLAATVREHAARVMPRNKGG